MGKIIVDRKLIALALSATVIGCAAQQPWSFNLADFLSAKELPYDSPPQVIYRIDDHRFVTLEHYRDCNHGETFYNDTKKNTRQVIGIGYFENFQGKIINADPNGNNVVLPLAFPPRLVCGDRGCTVVLWYSTDGGENFHSLVYMKNSFNPFEDSRNYTVAATKDKLYVASKSGNDVYVEEFPLNPLVRLDKPYPPGFHDQYAYASRRKLMPDDLRIPSGQDHITCDASIKPTNPDAPLVRNRQ